MIPTTENVKNSAPYSSSCTVILDLLSNSFLMGSDKSGMQVKAHKEGNSYHLRGNMEGSPTSVLKATLHTAAGVLTAVKAAGKVLLLLPTHPYVTSKCCPDPDHFANFGEADYRQVLKYKYLYCLLLIVTTPL